MQLAEIKKELQFNTELTQLIDILKNIAASQFHRKEKQKERFDEKFMDSFKGFFQLVNLAEIENPLVKSASDVLGIIMLTSDSGFMGGLNNAVIDEALKRKNDGPTELIILGERGVSYLKDSGNEKFKFFPGISDEKSFEQVVELRDYIVKEVLEKRLGKVVLSYPRPISFTVQRVEVINILPCRELVAVAEGKKTVGKEQKIIIESLFPDMVEYLVSIWLTHKLYEVFEDSKLSEFAARTIRLDESLQELTRLNKKLRFRFLRSSHEFVDKGMRETFAAKLQRGKAKDESAKIRV